MPLGGAMCVPISDSCPVYPRLDRFGKLANHNKKRTNKPINHIMKITKSMKTILPLAVAMGSLTLAAGSANAAITITMTDNGTGGVSVGGGGSGCRQWYRHWNSFG